MSDEPDWRRIEAQQARLGADMERLRVWAEEHPDLSAGVWFDNDQADANRGPVRMAVGVVGDSGEVATVEERLRRLLTHPDLLVVVPRRFTERELGGLSEAIAAAHMGDVPGDGVYVSVVAVDVRENKVLVSISDHDDVFAAELVGRYGADRVVVEQGVKPMPL